MKEKKIRVLGFPWHIPHQWSLLQMAEKYPIEFDFLINDVRSWNPFLRPKPKNLNWVTEYEPGKYDLALLHIDGQCYAQNLGKAKLYLSMKELTRDIPQIVINHATPMMAIEYGKPVSFIIKKIKEMVGNIPMVVNSHDSVNRWGWGIPIIHGIDPNEWWDLPKEPRVVTMVAGLMGVTGDKYYNRPLLDAVKNLLRTDYGIDLIQISEDWNFNMHKTLTGFDAYRDFLGRSLIYFNSTFDAPMPRSRSEAMLSGCCTVTTRHHDVKRFIDYSEEEVKNQGFSIRRNGIVVADHPLPIVKMISTLVNDEYKMAVQMGQEGKQTMIKYADMDRYHRQWWDLIQKTIKERKK